MVKFKLRIFRSCRSKDPSTLPNHPVPIFHHQPHRSSFKSHVSSAFGCASNSGVFSDSDYFHWQQDDHNWHVLAKIYDVESPRRKIYNSSVSAVDSEDDDDGSPFSLLPLLPPVDKKKRRRSRKLLKLNKLRLRHVSTSSNDSVLFSSEYSIADTHGYCNDVVSEDEWETLIHSSRSFGSTDYSTDFNPQLETIRESACISPANRHKLKKKRTTSSLKRISRNKTTTTTSPEYGSPARLSVFKKLIPCEVEGKMKESFAMVKRSEDPYEDFKRSMMEMIMEKEMFEESDLEQLLQCYLSLNSRVHHGVIVDAFSAIWDTMFGVGDDEDDVDDDK